MAEGREYGWNDVIKNDDQFILLEDGDYEFKIDHYERSRSKGGKLPPCNMAVVYFNISAYGDPQLRDNFVMHSSLEWKLSQLFMSVGLKKKGEELRMDWDKLPGLTGKCKITKVKNGEGSRNPDGYHNEIATLYPKESSPRSWTNGRL